MMCKCGVAVHPRHIRTIQYGIAYTRREYLCENCKNLVVTYEFPLKHIEYSRIENLLQNEAYLKGFGLPNISLIKQKELVHNLIVARSIAYKRKHPKYKGRNRNEQSSINGQNH